MSAAYLVSTTAGTMAPSREKLMADSLVSAKAQTMVESLDTWTVESSAAQMVQPMAAC